MSEPDRTTLPIRRPPFGGACNKTLAGSEPDWNLIGHPEPPPRSPNVLLVLIDDAGFGNAGTFGGPIDTPNSGNPKREGQTAMPQIERLSCAGRRRAPGRAACVCRLW